MSVKGGRISVSIIENDSKVSEGVVAEAKMVIAELKSANPRPSSKRFEKRRRHISIFITEKQLET